MIKFLLNFIYIFLLSLYYCMLYIITYLLLLDFIFCYYYIIYFFIRRNNVYDSITYGNSNSETAIMFFEEERSLTRAQSNPHRDSTRDIAWEVNRHATCNVTEVHRPRKSVYACLPYNSFNGATISPTRLYTYVYRHASDRVTHAHAGMICT